MSKSRLIVLSKSDMFWTCHSISFRYLSVTLSHYLALFRWDKKSSGKTERSVPTASLLEMKCIYSIRGLVRRVKFSGRTRPPRLRLTLVLSLFVQPDRARGAVARRCELPIS